MNYAAAQKYVTSLSRHTRREFLVNRDDCAWYLARLQFLLNLLGNPERAIPKYIHITGTSGKGSVATMLAAIWQKARRGPVGLVTSPCVDGTLDRAMVNGVAATEKEWAALVTQLKNILPHYRRTAPYDVPSKFELLTALSLLHFAKKKVTTVIIEVGLGGRYDSTNVIPWKDAAIITNIGRDHLDIIGPTLRDVAVEKAGIIKPNCRVYTMEQAPPLLKVIKNECARNHVPLKNVRVLRRYTLGVLGEHQQKNAALAAAVAKDFGIAERTIAAALKTVRIPIRFEVIQKKPRLIFDGAHNIDKMATTVAAASALKKIILVIGFSADKDIATMLAQLATLQPTLVICTRFTHNTDRRAAAPRVLARQSRTIFSSPVISFTNPRAALAHARQTAARNSTILVTGSMYLAGELRGTVDKRARAR